MRPADWTVITFRPDTPTDFQEGAPFQVFTTEDLGEALEDVRSVFKIARNFLDKLREEKLK